MLDYNDLHPYQKREIVKQIYNKYGYLFLDTGMGKTVISYAIHDQLKKRKLINRSLVIAPKKVMLNVWPIESKKWKFSKDFTFSIIHGNTYRGSAEYSRRMAVNEDADFYLINYEGLIWLSNYILRHGQFIWQCVFYDESTKMKSSTRKRFKAFKQLMSKFQYRYCLTGTPTPRGLDDIFGQAYCVDQGRALGKHITSFRNNYMRPLYTLHGRVTVYDEAPGARKKVAKQIHKRVSRLNKTDHLKLPSLNNIFLKLKLPKELEDMYAELEREFFLEIGGKEIEAFSEVALQMKLRQFLQGRMYTTKESTQKIHSEKLKALKEINLDGNTIIAYNFKFERDDIMTVTGNSPFIDSRTTDSQAEKWIIEWNNYEHEFFLINPASAAYGLNLQAGGNNVIWYSLTYNAEHYSQLIDRLWRQGQRKPVNVYHIVFEDTIDLKVSESLSRKDNNQKALLQDIIKYGKAR